jgi:hypothetical protein
MNNTIKYLGLLSILPFFTVVLTSNFMYDDVFAQNYNKSDADTKCRTGQVLVYHFNRGNYICTSEAGAAMWVRTGQAEIVSQDTTSEEKPSESKQETIKTPATQPSTSTKEQKVYAENDLGSILKLARANVAATIPLHKGYYNGESVYFIITDSSDPKHAEIITESQRWKVELAPPLVNAPDTALSTTYMFTNGVKGDGVHGFQVEVFTSTPAQPEKYSALTSHIHVTWNDASKATLLTSEKEILDAVAEGLITLTELDVVLNMPQIVWPGGKMVVKEDKTLADDTSYGGGQVLDINIKEMTVTFIAHRGWGPDGRTIYYIVTDATPSDPANMMGVSYAPTASNLIANSAAVDLFQFANGIKGSGPLGFQAGIAAAIPGDDTYSPMWRIFVIEWKDPKNASVLENIGDINALQSTELIKVSLARPMDSDHIVNCPFIDPFQ